jgi:hypothetical protein
MYKVTRKNEEESRVVYSFPEENTNKAIERLRNRFSNYIVEEDVEYIDVKKVREDNDIPVDAAIVGIGYGGEDSTMTFDIGNGDTKTVKIGSNPPSIMGKEETLYGIEVEYQRKCMNTEFFTEVLSGCWYVDDNTEVSKDDSLEAVTTKEEFDKIKEYVSSDDCPLNNWEFVEGENFIYFSY